MSKKVKVKLDHGVVFHHERRKKNETLLCTESEARQIIGANRGHIVEDEKATSATLKGGGAGK